MNTHLHKFAKLSLLLLGVACSFAARADYVFASIDYPGANETECWGMNNSGQVVCDAYIGPGPVFSFLYDSSTGTFTRLPDPSLLFDATLIGINALGVMVGSAYPGPVGNDTIGIIRDKTNAITTFSHPLRASTVARGIGPSGLIVGYAVSATGSFTGFIYDPKYDSYIDFLESRNTIAQGINGRNDVVGGTRFPASGGPGDTHGFLRDKFGTITLFRVDSLPTRARGITDSGQIAGFVARATGKDSGFVGTLAGLPAPGGNIPDAEFLDHPDARHTRAQGISNSGKIVGQWIDFNFISHGFIATAVPKGK